MMPLAARDACDAERLAAVQRDHRDWAERPLRTDVDVLRYRVAAGSASAARSNFVESCDVYIVTGRSFVHRTFRVDAMLRLGMVVKHIMATMGLLADTMSLKL
jgi:hypothetical protein